MVNRSDCGPVSNVRRSPTWARAGGAPSSHEEHDGCADDDQCNDHCGDDPSGGRRTARGRGKRKSRCDPEMVGGKAATSRRRSDPQPRRDCLRVGQLRALLHSQVAMPVGHSRPTSEDDTIETSPRTNT